MKAADFIYHRATNVAEALQYLEDYDGGARVLAGGQSLAPMLNMRLWRPAALIDINALSELAVLAPWSAMPPSNARQWWPSDCRYWLKWCVSLAIGRYAIAEPSEAPSCKGIQLVKCRLAA